MRPLFIVSIALGALAAPSLAAAGPIYGWSWSSPGPGSFSNNGGRINWVETELTAPAEAPFTLALDNQDNAVPHDVAIRDEGGSDVFKTEIITGVSSAVYDVPALPAGTYTFVCTIHPNMVGTLTAS